MNSLIKKLVNLFAIKEDPELIEQRREIDIQFIDIQTKMIYNEINWMSSYEVENPYGLESLNFNRGPSRYDDPKYIGPLVSEYSGVYSHIWKNQEFYRKTVPEDDLGAYFEAWNEFERQVKKFAPDMLPNQIDY